MDTPFVYLYSTTLQGSDWGGGARRDGRRAHDRGGFKGQERIWGKDAQRLVLNNFNRTNSLVLPGRLSTIPVSSPISSPSVFTLSLLRMIELNSP